MTNFLSLSLSHFWLQEKVTGSFKEGKVHEDVWALLLKPALAGAASAGGMCSVHKF